MDKRVWTGIAVAFALGVTVCAASAQQQPKDIRWGTPPVGTTGHKAMVTLSALLNKEMPQYRISVLPTAGAITTVKGFATKEFDGILRLGHRLLRARQRHQPLQGLQGAGQADAGPVVLVEHHRG